MHVRRRGFTLLEALVVLFVTAANNLKQIGMAAHGYHNTNHALPPGMRWRKGKDPMRRSTWLTQLLPYIEQQQLWDASVAAFAQTKSIKEGGPHTPMATVVRVYGCPADGRVSRVQLAPVDKIHVALTSYLGVSGKNWATRDGVLFRDSRVRLGDITDGTSNTLLAGERPPSADLQFGWWYAGVGQRFTGSADMVLGVKEQNLRLVKAGPCPPGFYPFMAGSPGNQCDMFHFWSLHHGGAHFILADGAVRFLTYEGDAVMPALASRAGGEVVEAP